MNSLKGGKCKNKVAPTISYRMEESTGTMARFQWDKGSRDIHFRDLE